jgi:uridine kinase
VLVGLSGIDASGKGFLAATLESRLRKVALNVALIGVEGWLNLPHVRFSTVQPGRHFYERGLRRAEMFDRLVLPLRDQRSIRLEMD